MKSLSDFKREELEAELRRRDQELLNSIKPVAKTAFDPEPLTDICEAYLNEMWDKGWADDDMPHYIFETAMTCVFGQTIFEKIKLRLRSER